jgi:hypothetical protein
LPGVIALAWFVAVLVGILWAWGGKDQRYFNSPDEMVNRLAAERVAASGRPHIKLADADPEDLRHPRMWLTMDSGYAIPSYPPVTYYLQGAIIKTGAPVHVVLAALSAAGVAALAAGAVVIGGRRRWLGVVAPAAAFPALYWMMRPWMNMATFLTMFCFAFLFFALWRSGRERRWLCLAALFVGLAAAVRPDYAPFLMAVSLIAGFAETRGRERWYVFAAVAAAGALAVALNVVLNAVTTGDPLTAAYEISDARTADSARAGAPEPLSKLMFVFLPYGLPGVDLVSDQLRRYWLGLGPVILITGGLLALIPLLARRSLSRNWYGLLVLVCAGFVLSRVAPGIFGAEESTAELRHSVTRYWTPVYLLAALVPLMLAMRDRRPFVWSAAATLCVVVACFGAYEIYAGQPESLELRRAYHARMASQIDEWRERLPDDALLYTVSFDKVLWSEWEVAYIPRTEDQATTGESLERALDSGRDVYLVQTVWPADVAEGMSVELARRGLSLRQVEARSDDVLRVTRAKPESARAIP